MQFEIGLTGLPWHQQKETLIDSLEQTITDISDWENI